MQIIFEDKDKKYNYKTTDIIDIIIYTKRVNKYVKEKHIGRFGDRRDRIQVSRGIFVGIKKRIWRRR